MAIRKGDRVKVFYRGTTMDGLEFDASPTGEPAEFVVGAGSVVQGMEQSLVGMSVGQNKTETYSPPKAFGPYRDDLIQKIQKADLPGTVRFEVGMKIHAATDGGAPLLATITELDETTATLDGNHPLAGKNVRYEFQVASIVTAETTEPVATTVQVNDVVDAVVQQANGTS